MENGEIRQIADQFIKQLHRIEQGDPDGIDGMVQMFCEDAELSNPVLERSRDNRSGQQGAAEFWRQYRASFREIRSEFDAITISPDAAGLFWRSTGADANGRAIAYEGASLLQLDDSGRIRRFRGYFDSAQLDQGA